MRNLLEHLPAEEISNTITHGFGLVLSIVGLAVLVVLTSVRGDGVAIVGCVIYGLSLVILYAASTVYHSVLSPRLKRQLQVMDHCGIYLLIAGSYTPFALIVLKGEGQVLLIAIWGFAVAGILAKLILRDRFPAISAASYLVMGWLGVFAIQPLFEALGLVPVALVAAGGVAYSLGVIFFAWKRFRHHHAIFHVFVLAGSIIHYAAVVIYVVPYSTGL